MAAVSSPLLVGPEGGTAPGASEVGGKALNLWRLTNVLRCNVPSWFCVTSTAFQETIEHNKLEPVLQDVADLKKSCQQIEDAILSAKLPLALEQALEGELDKDPFRGGFLAVRSSGTDEDSGSHSFAGQFESFLFQKGKEQVLQSLRKCWASCFSFRVMSHRMDSGMPLTGVKMAVIIQVMVNSEISGVAFSRHPLKPLSSDCVFIESVFGLGEGLVGGELEADSYEVSRADFSIKCELAKKPQLMLQSEGGGVKLVPVSEHLQEKSSLSDPEAVEIGKLLVRIEEQLGHPQDFEWAIEKNQLYCLQTRPIVTLPPSCFYGNQVLGSKAVLWDNSNIVESYAGVTSPLTFSFASRAYQQVYTLTLRVAGVPDKVVSDYRSNLANMIGLVRGNIYYNLVNWYRCLSCIPIGDTSKFMETMMGVKQTLEPELEAELGKIKETTPKYSVLSKIRVLSSVAYNMFFIDSLVEGFFSNFNKYYEGARKASFDSMSLITQVEYSEMLFKEVLGRWEVPIINDTYVMLFFGLLKSLVRKYLTSEEVEAESLQNDLLCGQGNVESTEPTKVLMKIAEYVDTEGEEFRDWFLGNREECLDLLQSDKEDSAVRRSSSALPSLMAEGLRKRKNIIQEEPVKSGEADDSRKLDLLKQKKRNVVQAIRIFLVKFGFRCINELKLEENTLHDDPGFVHEMVSGYVRSKSYSITNMEEREKLIRTKAEEVVNSKLPLHRRIFFNWVLYHTRRGVRHRENMRFSRTKLFGVFRNLFRAMGRNLVKLQQLNHYQDVFYLTLEDLSAYVEGRSVNNDLCGLVELRKKEFEGYKKGLPPPERFMTKGSCGTYFMFPSVLDDLNLLKQLEADAASDPNVLKGTPCSPGVVVGQARVVNTVDEAQNLNGEILITARTDPGWVPLYPLCSGLAIERGSLLSHSAVVARELGLPTIVGISGGLMKRIKTGMQVKLDGGKGTLTICNDENEEDK